MKWLLVALIVWAGSRPETVLQIPVASHQACLASARQIETDFGAKAAARALGHDVDDGVGRSGGILTSCLNVAG